MSLATEFLDLVVDSIEQVSATARRFRFVHPEGHELPPFSPGAHVTLFLDTPEGRLRNAYTLSGPVDDRLGYSVTVQREEAGRGGSRFLHDRVRPGDPIRLRAPLNYFPINHLARHHVFIAGGIGITPFLSMIAEVAAHGTGFELHYAFRSPDHAPYAEVLRARYGQNIHLWDSSQGNRMDLHAILACQHAGAQLYTCGPLRLIDAVEDTAAAIGWPRSHVQSERFRAVTDGAPFAVRLASNGETVRVGAHQSLLDALEESGHPVDYMCRVGHCGRCCVGAHPGRGQLIHNDQTLTEDEHAANDCIIPCVSRYRGEDLTLDL